MEERFSKQRPKSQDALNGYNCSRRGYTPAYTRDDLWKEASETWEYVVSDKVVYVAEEDERRLPSAWFAYSQNYIKGGLWFEVIIRRCVAGNAEDYLSLIHINSEIGRTQGGDLDMQSCRSSYNVNPAVFGDVPQFVQNPEGVLLRPVFSVVWLEFLDNLLCGGWQLADNAEHSIPVVVDTDRESQVTTRFARGQTCQPPSQVVQRCPEIIHGIPEDESYLFRRGGGQLKAIDVETLLRIELFGQKMRWLTLESTDGGFQGIEVCTRMGQGGPGVIKRMHE
jgi:hypothetical protein